MTMIWAQLMKVTPTITMEMKILKKRAWIGTTWHERQPLTIGREGVVMMTMVVLDTRESNVVAVRDYIRV